VVEIRREEPRDIPAIRGLNRQAFEQDQEADVVDALRANGGALLSLVATIDGVVVGHAMYSQAAVGSVEGAALGPIAVAPEHQRHGIGARLIEAGTRMLADASCPFVIVLGHPTYYPRFGFRPARSRGIQCEWDVPDEAFMVLALDAARMRDVTGVAKYRDEFSTLT
jgi:putative acetyltransferase